MSSSSDSSDMEQKRRHEKKRRHKDDDEKCDPHDESKSRKHKKHKSSRHDEKKLRRKHKKHKYESESDSDSSSSDSSTDSSSSRRRHRKRKSKQHDKNRPKRDRRKHKDNNDEGNDKPSFGKYGILKTSDKLRMQRSFEMWCEQVKSLSGRVSSGEESRLWEEYREDFNTATLPHKKYYNYDQWEMEEYQKNSQNNSQSSVDEQARLERQRNKADAEKALLFSTMNSHKIQDMRKQAELRSQMQACFKMGDMVTYQKLKDKLEAE
jgi:hypothetical protein